MTPDGLIPKYCSDMTSEQIEIIRGTNVYCDISVNN